MTKNCWQSKTLPVKSQNHRPSGFGFDSSFSDGRNHPQSRSRSERDATGLFEMAARLAAAVVVLAVVLVPSAYAQYVYVANAGEDTVSKIDINTNQEVARYATWFTSGSSQIVHPTINGRASYPWYGPAPSRIAQDALGNIYVLNRFFPQPPQPDLHLPVLLKIAPSGGTPTSTGPVLSMLDNVIANNKSIDPGEAADKRILWGKEIGFAGDEGALGRAVCIDTTGVLWVGLWGRYQGDAVVIPNMQKYYRVDPATGNIIGSAILTPGHSPYGCEVDTKGKLWSVDENNTLAEIDTFTNQVTIHNHQPAPGTPPKYYGNNYSVSVFNGCGSAPSKVYFSERSGKTYVAYDPQTSSFSAAPLTIPQFQSVAIAVDRDGNIVSGQWFTTGRVIKTTPGGTVLWDTDTPPAGPVVQTGLKPEELRGIIIDEHNDVWAIHLWENRVVKYSGVDGHWLATVAVGLRPYTYGNAPPPSCPCAEIKAHPITCEGQSNGVGTYSWSFLFTNHSPFSTPATAINLSSSQVTNLTPAHFQFTNPVPVNGQATVSGTFTVANPVPGKQVCFDIQLKQGKEGDGWCCPTEHVCFVLPECPGCAKLQASFKCQQGQPVLQLSVTNQGPTTANSVTVFSNTAGVTVSPQTTTQTFPQNMPVVIPLTVTGASAGQTISLTVNLNGPIDPKTGVNDWCCTSTVTVSYPKLPCHPQIGGGVFNDLNSSGSRDSMEGGLSGWIATLTDGKGTPRTTTTDVFGMYHFEDVEPGTYRLSVQPLRGWRVTVPEGGVHTVTVTGQPNRTFDFGFVKTQP